MKYSVQKQALKKALRLLYRARTDSEDVEEATELIEKVVKTLK